MAYYDLEEQETVIIYESATRLFDIYTTVPKHIKRLKNVAIATLIQDEKDSEDICITYHIRVEKLPNSYVFNR